MKIDVNHIAKLANLTLENGDKEKFEHQLSEILTHVERLKDVNTEKIKETSQSTGLENVTREDESQESLSQEEALSNAPKKHKSMFVVPALLGGGE